VLDAPCPVPATIVALVVGIAFKRAVFK